MRQKLLLMLTLATLMATFAPLVATSSALAAADARVVHTLDLKAKPLDLAIPGNGRYIYVLTADAKLQIFMGNGQLRDTVPVEPGVDRIQPGPREDLIYLVDSAKNRIQVLHLEFIQEIPAAASPTKGPAEAPVTVAVFTDFQCPYCSRLAPVLEQLLEKYPQKVRLVFKNLPLRSHKFAQPAATAALAAHAQGQFWAFHDALFKNYRSLNEAKVEEIRAGLNLDKEKFDAQRKDPQVAEQIQSDIRLARQAGVNSTPTVFINGRQQRSRSLDDLSAAVEAELKRLAAAK
jgi:protein-disulfide isomerase